MDLPNFNQPPIVEVSIGFSFKPLDSLKIPHLGTFWEKMKDDYPECDQSSPLGADPPAMSEDWPIPVPRVLFWNQKESHMIQLQNGRLVCNWQKQDDEKYPKYENLIGKFWNIYNKFSEFIDDEDLGKLRVKECSLDYINHIFYREIIDSASEIGEIIPDFSWQNDSNRFLQNPNPRLWRLHFDLPENSGTMRVELNSATRTTDQSPLFVFKLATRGINEDKIKKTNNLEAMKEWYDLSHEHMVKGFEELTSEKVQKEHWGKPKSS